MEESTGTKWQPNKLSENIMKTLILIYVRLIRTSRQMEMEKSGPISRTMYSSLSFRADPGVSLSTSLVLQKESKQRDPYGVFDMEGAILRDIGPYKNLVVFSSCSLDTKYVSHSSSIPLLQKLRYVKTKNSRLGISLVWFLACFFYKISYTCKSITPIEFRVDSVFSPSNPGTLILILALL